MHATYQGFSGPVIVILTVLIVGIGLAGWTWQQARSGEDGWYEIALPSGAYSVFVEDGDKEYCHRNDDRGRMCPIVIEDGVSEHNIDIDHAVW